MNQLREGSKQLGISFVAKKNVVKFECCLAINLVAISYFSLKEGTQPWSQANSFILKYFHSLKKKKGIFYDRCNFNNKLPLKSISLQLEKHFLSRKNLHVISKYKAKGCN